MNFTVPFRLFFFPYPVPRTMRCRLSSRHAELKANFKVRLGEKGAQPEPRLQMYPPP